MAALAGLESMAPLLAWSSASIKHHLASSLDALAARAAAAGGPSGGSSLPLYYGDLLELARAAGGCPCEAGQRMHAGLCVCLECACVCVRVCMRVLVCVSHTHTHSSNAPQPTRSYGLSSALCPVPAGHQRQGQSEQAALGEYLASATALSWRALLGMPHLEQMLAEVSLHASQLHAHARMHAAAAAAAASLACCPHTRPTWDGCSLRQVGSPGPVGLHSSNRPQGL